jgi:hypothetical protein
MQFAGQFGNQLHQYLTAKCIAEKTGLAYTPPAEFKTKNGNPVKWSGVPLFTMTPTPGRRVTDGIPQVVHCIQWYDLDSLDADRPIIIREGFFQRYELLRPWKGRIRHDWLRFGRPFVDIDPDTIAIHVRRTDYLFIDDAGTQPPDPTCNGCVTSPEEYGRCLEQFPNAKRVVFVTDDNNDPFIPALGKYLGLPWSINGGTWDNDFLLLASARNVIISQSTFSWWAAWLGRCEKIVCPCFEGSFWRYGLGLIGPPVPGAKDFPNLYPTDEQDRWVWLTE